MTAPAPDHAPDHAPQGRLSRWLAASATLNVPQAAGPVAFSLLALSLTGETGGGAAMILAMTLAQVAGAVPITRLGRDLPAAACFRLLVGFRTLGLLLVTLGAWLEAPFPWLIALAALAGSVNGAAYGYLRALLNSFAPAANLPRALGIAATLNELTFVLGPVLASVLGGASPVLAVLALTLLGAVPALAIPRLVPVAVPAEGGHAMPKARAALLTPPILLWLACATAGGATVAAIEIGAVALAIGFGYDPRLAILFTVPLCVASVAGGVWVSLRNRMQGRRAVVAQLAVMALGAGLAAFGQSVAMTVAGAMLIGAVLAPLATWYALILEDLAPPHRRAEVFALLRTANAMGVITASTVLTAVSVSTALVVVTVMMAAMTLAVALAPRAGA